MAEVAAAVVSMCVNDLVFATPRELAPAVLGV